MQIAKSRIVSAGALTAIVAGALTLGYVTGASAQRPRAPGEAKLLTGADIQFRVSGIAHRGAGLEDLAEGVLMVRVDGKWMVANLQDSLPPK